MPLIGNLRVSTLGIIPKKAQGKFRLIHHLSFPEGMSVNDVISPELCTIRYTSFDEAVSMVRRCGVGAELVKCDIKSAFRILPIHHLDFNLLGFQFQGSFYVDRDLLMSCSVSCMAFEKFSSFIKWKVRQWVLCNSATHYLDNFLFCGKRNSGTCRFILNSFQALAEELSSPCQRKDRGTGHIPHFSRHRTWHNTANFEAAR